ncbi:hypothetical protein ABZW32_18130 [Streptomyces sp. NPDC004667]|uniref:hypothetical protein n=1 Tax=Streptomyces sp. NPDC004667 TaxID=3154285 RepID=UPI0033A02808
MRLMGHHDRVEESPPLDGLIVVPDLDANVAQSPQRGVRLGQDLAQEAVGTVSAEGGDLPGRWDRVDEQPFDTRAPPPGLIHAVDTADSCGAVRLRVPCA